MAASKSLNEDERTERATNAAIARWSYADAAEASIRQRFLTLPLDQALTELAKLREVATLAAVVIQSRIDPAVTKHPCVGYKNVRGCKGMLADGQEAFKRDRMNHSTGLIESIYACSAACHLWWTSNGGDPNGNQPIGHGKGVPLA
jgi:hypothetical protein